MALALGLSLVTPACKRDESPSKPTAAAPAKKEAPVAEPPSPKPEVAATPEPEPEPAPPTGDAAVLADARRLFDPKAWPPDHNGRHRGHPDLSLIPELCSPSDPRLQSFASGRMTTEFDLEDGDPYGAIECTLMHADTLFRLVPELTDLDVTALNEGAMAIRLEVSRATFEALEARDVLATVGEQMHHVFEEYPPGKRRRPAADLCTKWKAVVNGIDPKAIHFGPDSGWELPAFRTSKRGSLCPIKR